MKRVSLSLFLASGLAIIAAPALADHHEDAEKEQKQQVEVVSVDEDGRPAVVRIDGFEVAICRGERTDGCINPRDAGLDEGGTEINYWPGRPASEIDEPLPVDYPK
jgi:hypothetical protein